MICDFRMIWFVICPSLVTELKPIYIVTNPAYNMLVRHYEKSRLAGHMAINLSRTPAPMPIDWNSIWYQPIKTCRSHSDVVAILLFSLCNSRARAAISKICRLLRRVSGSADFGTCSAIPINFLRFNEIILILTTTLLFILLPEKQGGRNEICSLRDNWLWRVRVSGGGAPSGGPKAELPVKGQGASPPEAEKRYSICTSGRAANLSYFFVICSILHV